MLIAHKRKRQLRARANSNLDTEKARGYIEKDHVHRRVTEKASRSLSGLALLSKGGCLFLVFFADLVELLHVLEEFFTPLKSDEELCLLAVSTVVGGLHSNRLGFDLLE